MAAAAAQGGATGTQTLRPKDATMGLSVSFNAANSAAMGTKATALLSRRALTHGPPGVQLPSLLNFLFPGHLENADSTGRLELFARYGPTDDHGLLHGGSAGSHIHTDLEISQMIRHNCKEALFTLFLPKTRDTVEVVVETLMKVAMAQRYTADEVKSVLKGVEKDKLTGRMNFSDMQTAIFASQNQRLKAIMARVAGGKPMNPPKERPVKVPYYHEAATHLLAITHKKKFNEQEEQVANLKRLHSTATLIAGLEQQNESASLRGNSLLMRPIGSVHDKWDRYCALRRTGRSSYVTAKNILGERFNPSSDEGLSNNPTHEGMHSLAKDQTHL
jgi:hypothetical protein